LWLLIDKFKGLGNSRGFVKNEIKYVPIWGWFFGLAEHIFLKRSYEKDKNIIETKVEDYLTNIDNNWLVLLAEGTRFSPEKHAVSEKFALERNLQPLKHHLIPRAKGFALTVPILKKFNCPTLYNVQLAFDKDAKHQATLGTLLRGQKIVAHVYIDRIPMKNVEPTFEYLYELYKEKDEMMESFNKYKNFYEGRKQNVVKGIKMEPRLEVKINSVCWMLLILCYIGYNVIQLILAGHIVYLLGTSTIIISVCE
jgi:lysophosphatidic acid acyltransferase / lysophosphatidylinositol acyltransferase